MIIPMLVSEPILDVKCSHCDKEYKYDLVMGWGCIVLLDQTEIPNTILDAWCNNKCMNEMVRFRYQ